MGLKTKEEKEVSTVSTEKPVQLQKALETDPHYQQLKDLNIKYLTQQYKTQGMVDFDAKKTAETVVAKAETTIMKGITSGQPLTAEQLKPLIPTSITDEKIRSTILENMLKPEAPGLKQTLLYITGIMAECNRKTREEIESQKREPAYGSEDGLILRTDLFIW